MTGEEIVRRVALREAVKVTGPRWRLVEADLRRTRDTEGRNRITLPRVGFLERPNLVEAA